MYMASALARASGCSATCRSASVVLPIPGGPFRTISFATAPTLENAMQQAGLLDALGMQRGGEHVADGFDDFVLARSGDLVRFGHALCGDRHLAEDLVQSVLARAHGRWSRIVRVERPEAHVRRMIVNEHLSWRRRRSTFGGSTAVACRTRSPVVGWVLTARRAGFEGELLVLFDGAGHELGRLQRAP
jgi:hypothetical protein